MIPSQLFGFCTFVLNGQRGRYACMHAAGWPDEFVKTSPKMKPNPFLSKLIRNIYSEKEPKILGYFCNFSKTAQSKQGDQMRLLKIAQNVAQKNFWQKSYITFTVSKRSFKNWSNFVIYKKTTPSKQPIKRRKFAQSGHPESKQPPSGRKFAQPGHPDLLSNCKEAVSPQK
jgi:hypothetical protein